MVSSITLKQDQYRGTGYMSTVAMSSKVLKDVDESPFESIQYKDEFTFRDDYSPKVRKPYTIMKRRERWTEDEHQKFIEALKLYGRAWKRIEEHVGTKTTVQIRSHAQKFFTKVFRESSSGEVNSVKPDEIPPPRPKRKPVHPYPRKVALSSQNIDSTAEKPVMFASMSPCLSVLEKENQSRLLVLSGVDTSEATNTSNGSVSPISSATDVHYGVSLTSVSPNRPSSDQANSSPTSEEAVTEKLLLISEDDGLSGDGSVHASSSRSLKLFGKTMVVTDSHTESTATVDFCKAEAIVVTYGSPVETLNLNMIPDKYYPEELDCSLDENSCSTSFPFQKDSSRYGETPLPWWTFSGSPFTSVRVYSPIPIKPCDSMPNSRELQDRDSTKERSSSGSNTESICLEGDEDRKSEAGAFSSRSGKIGILKHKMSIKGFVPYKRCVADKGFLPYSSMVGEERIEQTIRLSL